MSSRFDPMRTIRGTHSPGVKKVQYGNRLVRYTQCFLVCGEWPPLSQQINELPLRVSACAAIPALGPPAGIADLPFHYSGAAVFVHPTCALP